MSFVPPGFLFPCTLMQPDFLLCLWFSSMEADQPWIPPACRTGTTGHHDDPFPRDDDTHVSGCSNDKLIGRKRVLRSPYSYEHLLKRIAQFLWILRQNEAERKTRAIYTRHPQRCSQMMRYLQDELPDWSWQTGEPSQNPAYSSICRYLLVFPLQSLTTV